MTKKADLLRVTVVIESQTFDEDLAQQAFIEPSSYSALNTAIERNPGLFAKWSMLEARARAQHDELVAALETMEAELFTSYQRDMTQAAAEAGTKPPTLDAIKSAVTLDRRRQEQAIAVRDAKAALEMLIVGRRTIEQKRDSLLALASNWRQEMSSRLQVSDPRLLERARQARDRGAGRF